MIQVTDVPSVMESPDVTRHPLTSTVPPAVNTIAQVHVQELKDSTPEGKKRKSGSFPTPSFKRTAMRGRRVTLEDEIIVDPTSNITPRSDEDNSAASYPSLSPGPPIADEGAEKISEVAVTHHSQACQIEFRVPANIWSWEVLTVLPPKEFRRLTGLKQGGFLVLYDFLGGDEVCNHLKYNYKRTTPKKLKSSLSAYDRLLMTLTRLRRGFSIEDLALIFETSHTTVSTIFYVWIQLMYLQFKRLQRDMFVSRDHQPVKDRPGCFKSFKNFRAVLDSTELRIQTPYHYRQQGNTYSEYKSGNVITYLIGISCWGSISFISPGFEGSTSDRALIEKCDIDKFLDPGDVLLVDRGFNVQDYMDRFQVKVVLPPFLGDREKFTPEEESLTKTNASTRIHVERAIRKMKCFLL